MSDPDILLTIQAYTVMKMQLDGKTDSASVLKRKRLIELTDALVNEWSKRGNP